MISVERSFYERFPSLARGRGRVLMRPMLGLLRKVVHEERINAVLARLHGCSGLEFVDRCIGELGVRWQVVGDTASHIPEFGRVVIVANHPLGAVDALALLQAVGRVRPDVRILGNDFLARVAGLAPLLLPCDVFAGKRRTGLRAAYRALQREQALIVFPAGEVSRMRPAGVRDARWAVGFLRLARKTAAPVLPVHVAARNSVAFYGLSSLAKPLATLMLPREMFVAARATLCLTIGALIAPDALAAQTRSDAHTARRMRAHVYRLAHAKPPLFATQAAIAAPEDPARVRAELSTAKQLGRTREGRHILLCEGLPDGPVLREIGRLRELSFRLVGEGTGRARDLDEYDHRYHHILLWDDDARAILGAYRIADCAGVLAAHGVSGLYSASLFDYAPTALPILAQAAELGRSFVQPRYQGGRSLDQLWQGIGAWLRARPDIRHLLGPVSLSARLSEHARGWIVHYHRQFHPDRDGLARARIPYRALPALAAAADRAFAGLDREQALRRLRSELTACRARLPVLYRQYVDLCAPEGVRFLDFALDPVFAQCVDGLICLDLHTMRPEKRARYLAQRAALAGVWDRTGDVEQLLPCRCQVHAGSTRIARPDGLSP